MGLIVRAKRWATGLKPKRGHMARGEQSPCGGEDVKGRNCIFKVGALILIFPEIYHEPRKGIRFEFLEIFLFHEDIIKVNFVLCGIYVFAPFS